MFFYHDFEQPIEALDRELESLQEEKSAGRPASGTPALGAAERLIRPVDERIRKLDAELAGKKQEIYGNLSPWQRVQMARHPMRPTVQQMMTHIVDDFVELHGDRCFGDDQAVITGIGRIDGKTAVMAVQAKGKGTQENLRRNFGMSHPEGYRKARRMFEMAERFGCPVVTLIDTPGAYPGLAAEERGQAEAIAVNLMALSDLAVPVISVIVSEGGSGGALGLGVADRIYMLENAIYSVISPEGCAAILWKDAARAQEAASALKMTADELLKLGIIDGVIPEPLGGAHRGLESAAAEIRRTLQAAMTELSREPLDRMRDSRRARFRRYGAA
ncbi:acetyl-CoA carboxylase carboxyltransferase subunit alpha [bacterium]|nr:acetyl-CoA carboxylase carboxyltransferase subunit alpha [bacterium]